MLPLLLFFVAAASVPAATGPAPASEAASPELAERYRDAVRAAVALQFVTCDSPAARARIAAAGDRFRAAQPVVAARIGREAASQAVADIIIDPANLYTPGCPPRGELDRRIAAFEAAVASLEGAIGER